MKIELLEVQIGELKSILQQEIIKSRNEQNLSKTDMLISIWESLNSQKNIYLDNKKKASKPLINQWLHRNKKII